MDHDAMWTHVKKLMKFRDDFLTVSDMTEPQLRAIAEKIRGGMSRSRAHDEVMHPEESRLGYDRADGLRTGEELKAPGDSKPAESADPVTGKPPGVKDEGTGTDPNAKKEAPEGDGTAAGVGMQGDANRAAGEAVNGS